MTDELIKVTGEAAQVVKRIFTLCMEGRGPVQIAKVGRRGAQSHGLQAPAGPQDVQQGGGQPVLLAHEYRCPHVGAAGN